MIAKLKFPDLTTFVFWHRFLTHSVVRSSSCTRAYVYLHLPRTNASFSSKSSTLNPSSFDPPSLLILVHVSLSSPFFLGFHALISLVTDPPPSLLALLLSYELPSSHGWRTLLLNPSLLILVYLDLSLSSSSRIFWSAPPPSNLPLCVLSRSLSFSPRRPSLYCTILGTIFATIIRSFVSGAAFCFSKFHSAVALLRFFNPSIALSSSPSSRFCFPSKSSTSDSHPFSFPATRFHFLSMFSFNLPFIVHLSLFFLFPGALVKSLAPSTTSLCFDIACLFCSPLSPFSPRSLFFSLRDPFFVSRCFSFLIKLPRMRVFVSSFLSISLCSSLLYPPSLLPPKLVSILSTVSFVRFFSTLLLVTYDMLIYYCLDKLIYILLARKPPFLSFLNSKFRRFQFTTTPRSSLSRLILKS